MTEKFDFSKISAEGGSASGGEDQKESALGGENLPQEEKDKIVGEAQEEAEAENLEKELSPEVVEKIMEKVQDIDEKGIAYSVVHTGKNIYEWADWEGLEGSEKEMFIKKEEAQEKECSSGVLKKIFTEGLLGGPQGAGITKEKWAIDIKKKPLMVHFNIAGRAREHFENQYREIAQSNYVRTFKYKRGSITVLFDINHFKEVEPRCERLKNRTFSVNDLYSVFIYGEQTAKHRHELWREKFGELKPGDSEILKFSVFKAMRKENLIDEEGRPKAHTEYGFELANRVPPRYFTGIIDDYGPAENIANLLKEKKNFIPIYNKRGDLLWPKKMSYEEVKKFVAKRDKKKEENEKTT